MCTYYSAFIQNVLKELLAPKRYHKCLALVSLGGMENFELTNQRSPTQEQLHVPLLKLSNISASKANFHSRKSPSLKLAYSPYEGSSATYYVRSLRKWLCSAGIMILYLAYVMRRKCFLFIKHTYEGFVPKLWEISEIGQGTFMSTYKSLVFSVL